MKTLVLGYGNKARRDDGVGWFVIQQLETLGLPDVDLDARHQLHVELAETIAVYDLVIFVDAATPDGPEPVQCHAVLPAFRPGAVSHLLTPEAVLGLCQLLYGRVPRALLFSIRGGNFGFGELLSPGAVRAALEVTGRIADLIRPVLPPAARWPFLMTR